MLKIHHSIHIDAPREVVWHKMLDDVSYREWTKPFNVCSRYEGSWEEGSEIRFIGCDESGKEMGGMYSRIKENRLYEYISIEHLGIITASSEIDTTSDEVKKWTPAFENYTFVEKDGGTEVQIELDIAEEHKDMFEDMWHKALVILKSLAESN
jgi:uncharacterized protein YndB with AHSA1/START domain